MKTRALLVLLAACGPYAPPASHPETTSVTLLPPPEKTSCAAPQNVEQRDGPGIGTDGARLKAQYSTLTMTGNDGSSHVSQRFVGWFDTKRNEACRPMRAEDGKMRCLPVFVEVSAAYYVDARCAKPVVVVASASGSCDEPAPTPKYFALPFVASSCSLVTIAPLGPKVNAVSWYKKSGNACTPMGRVPATLDFYDASQEPLNPTEFVEMSISSSTMTP